MAEKTKTSEFIPTVKLTAEQQQTVEQFSAKVDLHDKRQVSQYAVAGRASVADYAAKTVESVNIAHNEITELLRSMLAQLDRMEAPDEASGVREVWHRLCGVRYVLKTRFARLAIAADGISANLKNRLYAIQNENVLRNEAVEKGLSFYTMLTMYLQAGNRCLDRERKTKLAELVKTAEDTESYADTQAVKTCAEDCDRFEEKLRVIEKQRTALAGMIRLIQSIQDTDTAMIGEVETTALDYVPTWKKRVRLALGLEKDEDSPKKIELAVLLQNVREADKQFRAIAEKAVRKTTENMQFHRDAETELNQILEILTER